MKIDTTNMCSHLQRKLLEGEYSAIRDSVAHNIATKHNINLLDAPIGEIVKY